MCGCCDVFESRGGETDRVPAVCFFSNHDFSLKILIHFFYSARSSESYGESDMFSLFSFRLVFSELYEHHYNTSTGKVLFTAAKTLCQMLEADVPMVLPDDMDLPAVIHDLACQAITVCHSGREHT